MTRRLFDIAAAAIVLGPPLCFWVTYTGPYRWLAELQVRSTGGFHDTLTFLGTYLVWILVAGGLLALLERGLRRAGVEGLADFDRFGDAVDRGLTALKVAGPLLGLAAGAFFWLSGLSMQGPVPVDVGRLAAAPSRYVRVEGARLLYDQAVVIERGLSAASRLYVPMVRGRWEPGEPIGAFLDVPLIVPEPVTRPPDQEGMVRLTGLPGRVRSEIRNRAAPLAPRVVVVDSTGTPAGEVFLGQLIVGISAFLGALAAFDAGRRARRR